LYAQIRPEVSIVNIKMQILPKLKYYLARDRSSIFISVTTTFLVFSIISILTYFKIISKFSLYPIKALGYAGGHSVSLSVDGLFGIIMAFVLFFRKKKFSSLAEIGILSFWSSFFLSIVLILTIDVLLFVLAGVSQMEIRFLALIAADLFGLLLFTVTYTVISVLINAIIAYFNAN
jgi:hypothetical protein